MSMLIVKFRKQHLWQQHKAKEQVDEVGIDLNNSEHVDARKEKIETDVDGSSQNAIDKRGN